MLNKYKLFLRWWLFAVLISVGFVFAWNLHIFHEIYEKDITKLSFVILAIFTYMSLWCGWKTFKLTRIPKDDSNKIVKYSEFYEKSKRIKELSEIGWFTSDLFLTLGMVGTVVGFIMMFSQGFASMDITNAAATREILGEIAYGMSTALYTTLVGLISSALLKIQYFNLTLGIKEIKK